MFAALTLGALACSNDDENAPPSPPLPASDAFEGAVLDPSWSLLNDSLATLGPRDGALEINLLGRALWAGNERGVLVSKRVRGDFRVSARVQTSRTSAPAEAPAGPVRLGGLTARKPNDGAAPEDYVHVVVGYAPTGIAVETKTTVAGATSYDAPAWPAADAALRICRRGATFRLYKRPPTGGAWQLAATHERPDLPDELDVGANAYSVLDAPDLRVRFEEVTFEPVGSDADCSGGE